MNTLHEMKNEKNYMVFLYIKCSKFWSVSLEHFIERKPLIYEEWNGSPKFFFPIRHLVSISRGVAFDTPLPFPWWTGQSTTNYWDEWFLLSEKTIILFRYTLSIFIVGSRPFHTSTNLLSELPTSSLDEISWWKFFLAKSTASVGGFKSA